MKIIDLTYTDSDNQYKTAENYDGTQYYNSPITATIKGKKYILPFGTGDTKRYWYESEDLVYIVAENTGLNYISMVAINTKDLIVQSCYLDYNALSDIGGNIFDLTTEQQVKVLSNYLDY